MPVNINRLILIGKMGTETCSQSSEGHMIIAVIIILIIVAGIVLIASSPQALNPLRTPFICISWAPAVIAALTMRARAFTEATMGYGLFLGLAVSVLFSLVLSLLGIRLLVNAHRKGEPRTLLFISTILAALPFLLAVVSLLLKRFFISGNG
jgi:hypothetical protein